MVRCAQKRTVWCFSTTKDRHTDHTPSNKFLNASPHDVECHHLTSSTTASHRYKLCFVLHGVAQYVPSGDSFTMTTGPRTMFWRFKKSRLLSSVRKTVTYGRVCVNSDPDDKCSVNRWILSARRQSVVINICDWRNSYSFEEKNDWGKSINVGAGSLRIKTPSVAFPQGLKPSNCDISC